MEHAWLLERLEENSKLSTYAQRRVHEYREHLVREEIEPQVPEADEVEETERVATDEEVEAAIAEAKELGVSHDELLALIKKHKGRTIQ